ncbi:MAG: glycosyltransferase [Bacteroidetes bacterium]|nr:glycosyltransferase [Bacteroidota bacterium]
MINQGTKDNREGNRPLVSVCIQTYQHAAFIKQCLDSIISQKTNFPFEIILGEDESTDGTREICVQYAEKYPDLIRLFLRSRKDVIKINGKETGRFNFKENLKSAKGNYIAICEGDDFWIDENKLQYQFDFLESNAEYSVCFHKVKILKNNELIDDYITKVPSQTSTIAELAGGNYIHTPTVMFRNHLVLPIWFDEILAGDYALHVLNALNGKLYCMDRIMAVYRIHGGGIWSTNSEESNQLKWLSVLTTLCNNLNGEVRELIADQRLNWAIILFNKGYQNETEEILRNEIPRLLKIRTDLLEENEKLLNNPDYYSAKVSGTFLTKALSKKIFKRLKSGNS